MKDKIKTLSLSIISNILMCDKDPHSHYLIYNSFLVKYIYIFFGTCKIPLIPWFYFKSINPLAQVHFAKYITFIWGTKHTTSLLFITFYISSIDNFLNSIANLAIIFTHEKTI